MNGVLSRHVISTDLAPAHGASDNVSRDNCFFLSHALIGAIVASIEHKRIITHLPEQSRANDFFLKPRVLQQPKHCCRTNLTVPATCCRKSKDRLKPRPNFMLYQVPANSYIQSVQQMSKS